MIVAHPDDELVFGGAELIKMAQNIKQFVYQIKTIKLEVKNLKML